MPKCRHQFPCGHRGYGTYCHLCKQSDEMAERFAAEQKDIIEWYKSFQEDEIYLRHLPGHLVEKARRIIKEIKSGTSYQEFKGKRLRGDRSIISIRLNRDYRLLFKETDTLLEPFAAVSHEDYDHLI